MKGEVRNSTTTTTPSRSTTCSGELIYFVTPLSLDVVRVPAMRQLRLSAFILLGSILSNWTYAENATEQLLGESNPKIQAQLAAVLDSASVDDAIQKSRVLKKGDLGKDELLKQVAIFAATPGDEQPLRAGIILRFLDLEPKVVIRTLAPYLGAENQRVRSFVRDWFRSHDSCGSGPSSLGCFDYTDYLSYVRGQLNRHEETPPAFIEYIYERSPAQALLIFIHANPQRRAKMIANLQELNKRMKASRKQQTNEKQSGIPPMPPTKEVNPADLAGLQLPQFDPNEVRLAEIIISNAIRLKDFDDQFQLARPDAERQLEKLANHSEWWARLYVAAIMRRHWELRDPDVLDKLKNDSHELVRKAACGEKEASKDQDQAANVPLVAPRHVEARPLGGGKGRVDWSPSDGATSYSVLRRRPDTEKEFTTIATDVRETTYTDDTGEAGVLYEYRIIAHASDELPQKVP